MDLRSILDNPETGDRDREREREQRERERAVPQQAQPPTPQQQPHHIPPHHQQQQQSPVSYPYRDYGHSAQPHPSPGKPPGRQEYPPHPAQHAQYPPQSPYQQPSGYQRQSGPPPQQAAGSFHDVRSPTGMPAPSPTAYRPTPTPTHAPAGASGGYPFPQQDMTSPSMRNQYPPSQYPPQPQRQESYPHGAPTQSQHAGPPPHPSPGAAPGPHGYAQRSQSQHSTPTPTSAHSQQQYGSSYIHGSPVAMTHPPPAEYNRHPSQPPTPHGPPLSAAQRQPTAHGPYAQQQAQVQQPASPYQTRMPSTPSQIMQTQTSPPPPQRQPSHPAPQPAPTQNRPHDPLAEHRRPLSHHERDHSLSVSPKTRVPSLPSNADRTSQSVDRDHRPSFPEPMAVDSERAATPAKRKLDDRDLSPPELERKVARPPPGQVNGEHVPKPADGVAEVKVKQKAPAKPRNIRKRHQEPPIWAQSYRSLNGKLPKHDNFVLAKRTHAHLNGGHATPEKKRSQPPQAQAPAPAEPNPRDLLGPWEASITGTKPLEEIPKQVTDFLFLNVVTNEDAQEIASRGIKFEIEAKLGTLIDKDMNRRVDRDLATECLLANSSRIAFKSSMTEVHHKFFNEYLNQLVIQSDPRAGPGRLPLVYRHHRQTDSFVDLPPELQQYVPGCMSRQQGGGRRNVRVRISRDQKTKEVVGKIVKARVADLDLHIPMCPMDCRLSVNLEMEWGGPVEELEELAARQRERQPDRNKDRMTYTHGHYQVDLTQVTQQITSHGQTRLEKEHELEIELNPDILIKQGHQAMNGEPHRLPELIEGLVDNIRILARKASEMDQ